MASSPKQPRTELYSPTYTGNIGSSLAESFFVSVSCVELWIVIVNCDLERWWCPWTMYRSLPALLLWLSKNNLHWRSN
jgi:hypothetical protein